MCLQVSNQVSVMPVMIASLSLSKMVLQALLKLVLSETLVSVRLVVLTILMAQG